MEEFLKNRIKTSQINALKAIDEDDFIAAAKYRAIQKELLEVLKYYCAIKNENNCNNALEKFRLDEKDSVINSYTAARILGLNVSSVTRKAQDLNGFMLKGKWFFYESQIKLFKEQNNLKTKRGRKSKGENA
ncbi:hypothetical protein VO178_02440 [Lysinibacillus fusiformis]|uniref:hypothetical protein n=1 Tax=Lysinibacillus fusiformis TaxID=28031 RepID=UPI002D77C8D3|nr:hypothetical protein [Lysinibacillus fusiformis]WRS98593.1 hypothetical protein VO178_02440 [Lysinibacillus fusiformis]